MRHTEKPPDPNPREAAKDPRGEVERPDLRKPRGNQEIEQQDVDRGQGKLDRVLGW